MREIKFRAFLKKNKIVEKKYVKKDVLTLIEVEKGLYDVVALDFQDKEAKLYDWDKQVEFKVSFIEIELMQYTDLKDKNGMEIYEGDILELRVNLFDKERDLFQVVFKDGGFRDEWNNYIGQYLPPDIRNRQGGRVRLNEACEVIGNIYENPELLKG